MVTPEHIIKNNVHELEDEDFTFLLTSISCNDPQERRALVEVLKMFKNAGVEPFNKYAPAQFQEAVERGCEVMNPQQAMTGMLVIQYDYKARWEPIKELLDVMGITFKHYKAKFESAHTERDYYLFYWAADEDTVGVAALEYWTHILGGEWTLVEVED